MNFVDYCIATKNFSALQAVQDYTQTFGIKDTIKKYGRKVRNKLLKIEPLKKLNSSYIDLKKSGYKTSDILKGLFNKDKRGEMKKYLGEKARIKASLNQARNNDAFRQIYAGKDATGKEVAYDKGKGAEKAIHDRIKAAQGLLSKESYNKNDKDKYTDMMEKYNDFKNPNKLIEVAGKEQQKAIQRKNALNKALKDSGVDPDEFENYGK